MSHRLSQPSMISALGMTPAESLTALLNHDQRGLVWRDDLHPEQSVLVGQAAPLTTPLQGSLAKWDCRNNRMLNYCCEQLMPQLQPLLNDFGADRIGVIIGTSTSGIAEYELALAHQQQFGQLPNDYHYRKQEIGSGAQFVADRIGANGPAYTISTACSSSAKALAAAARMLDSGLVDAVVCGGCDSLSQLTINGFCALQSYAQGHCRPLAEDRDGINIGEAAVLFVMTRDSGGIQLAGFGESSDGYHVSAPEPHGRGAETAMRLALESANLSAAKVDYLNLHGTATPLNDEMECLAIYRLCRDKVPVSSTKALTGHTLGAAGALEAALAWLLLSDLNHQRQLPSHANHYPLDPTLAPVLLASHQHRLPANGGTILSNSFAFGGSNISLLIRRLE
ncbi:beta-ketoacyl-ACP synthase [Ferrimonas senticii]|uniref:beta-ketoacyl-ACP synthase n=1 Tax=Ferrimonas senticii TaxID=394566 RepID=UPI000426887A|nr:beta-ketoacyl-ACP synthase [Ferrimonas senticii]